jgi:peptidoglycan/LPS O-acetylase OafA/YrhL
VNNRIYGLDALRYISLLCVVANHFYDVLHNLGIAIIRPRIVERLCELGIAYFFVSSAFLITTLFLAEYERNGKFSLYRFLVRRGLRLLPAYLLLVLLVYFLVYRLSFFYLQGQPEAYFFNTHTSIFNFLFLVPQANEFFHPTAPYLFHTWTLGMEFQFYLATGFLFRYFRKQYLTGWALLFLIVTAFILLHTYAGGTLKENGLGFVNTIGVYIVYSQLSLFALGVFAAFIFKQIQKKKQMMLPGKIAGIVFFAAFFLYLLYAGESLTGLWAGGTVFLLMLCIIYNQHFLQTKLTAPVALFLGNISYGAYLFHYIIMVMVVKTLSFYINLAQPINLLFALVLVFAACTLAGVLSYYFIEKPFLQLKKKYTVLAQR